MKFLIIYFDIIELSKWEKNYHFGIGSISSYLKKKGVDVRLIYLDRIPDEKFLKDIERFIPDLIGFSFTSSQFKYVEQTAVIIKKKMNVPIVCGGIHTIINPDEVIAIKPIDMVCTCEGELFLAELLEKVDDSSSYSDIKGLWYKEDGRIIKNEQRDFIHDLDILSFGDRDLFGYKDLYEPGIEKLVAYKASRGCPYNCHFCANKTLKEKLGLKSPVRFHSVEYIISELQYLKKKYSPDKIRFEDDVLPLKKEWFETLMKTYKKEINIPFKCNMRYELISKDNLTLLKESGCFQIQVGVESGNEEYRKRFLNRNISQEKIISSLKSIKKEGFILYTFNIIGGPEEKPCQVIDTIKVNAESGTDMVQLSIMNPYPGTYIYDYCREHHLLRPDFNKVQSYFEDVPVIRNKYLTPGMILFYKNHFFKLMRFYRKLYKLPPIISGRLIKLTDIICGKLFFMRIFPLLQNCLYYYRVLRNFIIGIPLPEKRDNIEGIGVNK